MRDRPSMQDVARAAGLSKMTVSLALRNDPQIPERTRARVREVARRLGYAANPVVARLMSELRACGTPRFQANLALVNGHRDAAALRRHPTVPVYVEGIRRRAAQLGYGLEEFWLHDGAMRPARLVDIFQARGVRGILIVGMMDSNLLPPAWSLVWERWPCVVTGVRTQAPALSFCCADHFGTAMQACERALALGYQRPALVLEEALDRLVERRFSAGMLMAQQSLPVARRVPAFGQVREARSDRRAFARWWRTHRPDCLLTLFHVVREWVEAMGLQVPGDVGLVQLEWRPSHRAWAGMDQHNDLVGEAAVDMLVGQILGNSGGGAPTPRATMLSSTWVDGETVQRLSAPC